MIQRLPQQWCLAPIGACLHRRKETVAPWKSPDQQFGFVGLEDIEDGGRGGVRIAQTPGSEIESLKTSFREGDVLYGKLRPYLNKVAVALQGGICSTDIWAFKASSVILPHFAYYVLGSQAFVERVSMLTRGANLPRVDSGTFDGFQIPLPPLSEQRRIVEILREAESVRRLRADADRKTAELVPAIFHDMFGDPEANPKNWPVKALGRLLLNEPQNGLYRPSSDYGSGTPIIRITDFYDGRITAVEFQRVRVSATEAEAFRVSEGNILLNRVNSMEFLGKSALVERVSEPTIFESNMMRLTVDGDQVAGQFLIELLQTPAVLGRLRRQAKHAVNQASVNQGDVMSLSVIVPPLELQRRFARTTLECRSLAGASQSGNRREPPLEQELVDSLLARAFSGELTAGWRERHARTLKAEVESRDDLLKAAGVAVARLKPIQDPEARGIFGRRTEGAYAHLTEEHHAVFEAAEQGFGGVLYPRWFTAADVARRLSGPLHSNPAAVKDHLDILAARGLVIAVSREQEKPLTGETEYGSAYRLPLGEFEPKPGDTREPRPGDRARMREMERLAKSIVHQRNA